MWSPMCSFKLPNVLHSINVLSMMIINVYSLCRLFTKVLVKLDLDVHKSIVGGSRVCSLPGAK